MKTTVTKIMTILTCFEGTTNTTQWAHSQETWYWASFVLVFFYFALFLFGLVPMILYWNEFKSLSHINIAARLCFTIALFLKCVVHILTLLPWGHSISPHGMRICGYIIFSLPSYFITTCFSIVLISWIMLCMQILPLKIAAIFKKAKLALVLYNIIIYMMFIISIVLECLIDDPPNPEDMKMNMVSGYFDIIRDLILFILFFLFVFLLQKGLGDDQFAESTIEQKTLFWLVIMLGFLMLTRGIISLIQVLIPSKQECSIGFFIAYLIEEILIEGVPLFLLLRINNGFLGTQRRMSFDISNPSLYTEQLN